MKKIIIIGLFLLSAVLIFGCTQPQQPASTNLFTKLSNIPCLDNNKPIIRFFSTTWCPHCQYADPIFAAVMQEYGDKITVRHYDIDVNTPPADDMAEFKKFSPNGNIPAYSFGCEYYRIGNSFESTDDINAEKTEFRRVINLLLSGQ